MQGFIVKASTLRSRLFSLMNAEKQKIDQGVKPGDRPDIPDWEVENWKATDDFWKHFETFVGEIRLRFPPIGPSYEIRPRDGGFYLSDTGYQRYQGLVDKHFVDHTIERERDGYRDENTRWYWSISVDAWVPTTVASRDWDRIDEGLPPIPDVLVNRKPYFELKAWLLLIPERSFFVLGTDQAKEWGITRSDVLEGPTFWVGFNDTYPFE